MLTEDFCSYKVAKLLKEKGFHELVNYSYDVNGKIGHSTSYDWNQSDDCCSCITQALAMKWLREEHKIHIVISPVSGKGYGAILCDVGDFDDFNYIGETDYFFHTEEAVEAALKYSLENLI